MGNSIALSRKRCGSNDDSRLINGCAEDDSSVDRNNIAVPSEDVRNSSKLFTTLKNSIDMFSERIKHLLAQLEEIEKDVDNFRTEVYLFMNTMKKEPQKYDSSSLCDKTNSVYNQHEDKISKKPVDCTGISVPIRHYKEIKDKKLINRAITENDFLKRLTCLQIVEIIDMMYLREYECNNYITREGDRGTHLFVSASGNYEVSKDGKVLRTLGPNTVFGEISLLYDCNRTASVKVTSSKGSVWILDRQSFRNITSRIDESQLQETVRFLQNIPLFGQIPTDDLIRGIHNATVDFYVHGECILTEKYNSKKLHVVIGGIASVHKRIAGATLEETIRALRKGDYFMDDIVFSSADGCYINIVAQYPGLECFIFDVRDFIDHIPNNVREMTQKLLETPMSCSSYEIPDKGTTNSYLQDTDLDNLEIIATIGKGAFGTVFLAQYENSMFALKVIPIEQIRKRHTELQLFNEQSVMMSCDNSFICRLYKTFRSSRNIYLLLEPCLGGEVRRIMIQEGILETSTVKFITGCIAEAVGYLHEKNIIYRDLKPENTLIASNGYIKLCDFGFAKLLITKRTQTVCGTPEYTAPEVFLNKCYDCSVDCWSLGVLIFEMLTGRRPFKGKSVMEVYENAIKGINTVVFPETISMEAKELIKRLCHEQPAKRIRMKAAAAAAVDKETVQGHSWLENINWERLRNQTLPSPITVKITGSMDVSNFLMNVRRN